MSLLGRKGRRKIKTNDELLEEKIKQKEKAYLKEEGVEVEEEKPEKKVYKCDFCDEPFSSSQKLSWHIRKEHKGEKSPVEEIKEVKEEEHVGEEPSLEEVVYGLSGQAALLTNLKRFELTEAEAESIDTGVELITNTVRMYLDKIGGREEK